MILAYGLTRLMTQVFGELRDALFARVGQHAIRTVALHTFQHLHNLSLGPSGPPDRRPQPGDRARGPRRSSSC